MTRHHHTSSEHILEYVDRMFHSDSIEPIAYIDYNMYDEAEIRAAVRFNNDKQLQQAKKFVVIPIWSVLWRKKFEHLQEPIQVPSSEYFLLVCHRPASVRAGEGTRGEAVASVLKSIEDIPSQAKLFKHCVRISECDGAGGNARGEKILLSQRSPEWCSASFLCQAHRIHTSIERTWDLQPMPSVLKGIIHVALFLNTAGTLKQFKASLREHLRTTDIYVTYDACPASATARRHQMLRLFGPSAQEEPNRYAKLHVMSETLLNGDWSLPVLQHHCGPTCCTDLAHLRVKLVAYIPKMISALTTRILARNNWKDWVRGMRLCGLLEAVHNIFSVVFQKCFDGKGRQVNLGPLRVPQDDAAAGFSETLGISLPQQSGHEGQNIPTNPDERRHVEMIMNERGALQMMSTDGWHLTLCTFMQAAKPQIHLVSQLLSQASPTFDLKQMELLRSGDPRTWRVLDAHLQRHLLAFFQTVAVNLNDDGLWNVDPGNDTEFYHALVFRFCTRCAAVIYQLLAVKLAGFPHRMFSLLVDQSIENTTSILQTPKCLLDGFSRKMLETYDTIDKLRFSTDLHQTLAAMAHVVIGTTYPVECVHTQHSRSKVRGAHPTGIEMFALKHVGWTGPSYLRPIVEKDTAAPRGRPKKRVASIGGEQAAQKRRRGGGGAWRAFVHQQTVLLGEKPDFGRLAEKYHALTEEQRIAFTRAGKQGPPLHV